MNTGGQEQLLPTCIKLWGWSMVVTAGIIANPASGKDIRRLVAYGTVFDNQEKVNIVRRALLGLAATGVERVLFMPDYYGIVYKAVNGLSSQHHLSLEVIPLEMELTGTQIDSCRAAQELNRLGAGCIITLGGDGTNRMVAKGCGRIPLVPVSTGTNNVFPEMVEGTIAGLAAGLAASGDIDGPGTIIRTKKLTIFKCGQPADIALIDAVVLQDNFIGSRAVWDTERIKQIVVTRGEPQNIGISSIAGHLDPIGISEPRGLAIDFEGDEIVVLAPIAPGLIRPVRLHGYRPVALDEEIAIGHIPCVIALDGEREVEVRPGETAAIRLDSGGPNVVNIRNILRQAVASGFFRRAEIIGNSNWLKEGQ